MSFDYEAVTWGGGALARAGSQDFLDHALHLEHALSALEQTTGRVLEIGCGSGRFIASVAAARPDLAAHGCDISDTALRPARERHPQVAFERADAEKLPYPEHHFEAVLMIDVLEHLPSLHEGLAEVRRVLAPGGVFHLVFPCEGQPGTLLAHVGPLRRSKRTHAGHLHQISRAELARALRAAGLAPVRWRHSYHLLGQLYDAAIFGALGAGIDMHRARSTHLESGKGNPWVGRVRRVASRVLYWESRVAARVPGMTVHVTCT